MELKRVLNILEDISRGKHSDSFYLLGQSKELFKITSQEVPCADSRNQGEQIKSAISLHNKLRNLPQSLLETKAYLRASAGFLLTNYGDKKTGSVCSCIKIFVRACQELVSFPPDGSYAALSCVNAGLNCWQEISTQALSRFLSPVDYSELRISVFHGYLERSRLLLHLQPADYQTEMRLSLSRGLEFLRTMPPSIKNAFSKNAVII